MASYAICRSSRRSRSCRTWTQRWQLQKVYSETGSVLVDKSPAQRGFLFLAHIVAAGERRTGTMKKALMAGVALLCFSAVYGGEKERPRVWTSGTDLATQCSHIQDQFSTGACTGYVVAAAEIADSGRLKGYR